MRGGRVGHGAGRPVNAGRAGRRAAVGDHGTGSYDHAGALEATERFFWLFCDDYLELVKSRAYGSGARGSGVGPGDAAGGAVVLLRLFAPFLPFVTEEVWSWWQEGSVHRAAWPSERPRRLGSGRAGDPAVLETAAILLGQIRKAKSAAKVSMRAEAARVCRAVPDGRRRARDRGDLGAAGNITDLSFVLTAGGELTAEVTLARRPDLRSRGSGPVGAGASGGWSTAASERAGRRAEAEHRALAHELVAEPGDLAVRPVAVGDQHDLGRPRPAAPAGHVPARTARLVISVTAAAWPFRRRSGGV